MIEVRRFKSFGVRVALVAAIAVTGCGTSADGSDEKNDTADSGLDAAVGDTLEDTAGRDTADTAENDSVQTDASDVKDLPEQELPPEICRTASTWNSADTTTKVFTDQTESAGLKEMGVTGIRVGSVDFDNDGLPDLVIRNTAATRGIFEAGGAQNTWLLKNIGGFRFEDVTESSGFTATRDQNVPQGRVTHVVVWGDVDNDGDLDAYSGPFVPAAAASDVGDRAELLINNGDGTFLLGSAEVGFRHPDDRDPTMGASFLDYDRDGNLDIFVGYGMQGSIVYQDRLFKGTGTGSFTDVTEAAGLKQAFVGMFADENYKTGKSIRNTWGTTVADLNNDGWPDIMESVYGRYFNALYLGGPDGFTDWSIESGYASDDRRDWTTNLNAQCYCKLNPDAEGCSTCPAPPGYFSCSGSLRWDHSTDRENYRLGGNTFSTAAGDVDNDGDLDLFTFEIVHWDVGDTSDPAELLLNDGSAKPVFSRPGNEMMGLARDWGEIDWNAGDMTGALFDFDNDGRLDVLIASSDYPYTRAFLFHQKTDGKFEQVPYGIGIDHPHAHGVAVSDFDLDGDLDVALGHSRARCSANDPECYPTQEVHVFKNEVGQNGNWLRVNLVGGEGSNRAAIGAVVKVTAGGTTQMREVGGGYGHVGIQHEMTQHFGLGSACNVDRVEVRWPDAAGTVEVFNNVRGNYVITIQQGEGVVRYSGAGN